MEINNQDATKTLQDIVIHFPNGLIGFETLHNFKIFHSETEKDLHWLQPVEDQDIEFAVTLPDVFQVNYEINLSNDDEQTLQLADKDQLVVLVTLSKNLDQETDKSFLNANFMAPIIINTHKKTGIQKILEHKENPVTITMRG